jgi:hypothetical protein
MTRKADARLIAADLEPEQLQALARELCLELNRETDVQALPAEGSGGPGTRGDAITIGGMVLAFLSSGAAVGLVKVFEAYVARRPSLELELQKPDGRKLRINAQGVRPEQIENTARLAREFFGE